jgi:NhaP-type Na+/H+ or K+/H+ antiporter
MISLLAREKVCLSVSLSLFLLAGSQVHKLYIGESVLATAFGILIGPHGVNIFNPRSWSDDSNPITLEVMRVTLAAGLFAIGVELPQAYMARHWRSLITLVVPTMAVGWVTSAGFMFLLFPDLNFISALCISACLTPTDPVSFSHLLSHGRPHSVCRSWRWPSHPESSQRNMFP